MKLDAYFKKQIVKIDRALLGYLPKKNNQSPALHQAMRYAVMSGGKRIRPILALAACEAVGGDEKKTLAAACALEFIHSYSLVHDDLPCMDNDTLRRGKPTCHVKFGEATSLLAGDALLTLAFKVLTLNDVSAKIKDIKKQLETVHWIAEAIGVRGMVGGQALEMEFQGKEMDLPTAEYVNAHKSGALIAVSLRAGACLGGGTPREVDALYRYGKHIGLLFQLVDDIMDTQGYVQVIGLKETKRKAESLLKTAKESLVPFGEKGGRLRDLAGFILNRKN